MPAPPFSASPSRLHDKAIDWAKVRVQGGKPLIEHDGIRAQLAEMRMLIDASRSYIHRACWLADHQEHGWDKTLGVLPKAMASQAAWKIATWCLEIHGGHGYMKEFGVEKLVRDAAAFLHSDGVNRTLVPQGREFHVSVNGCVCRHEVCRQVGQPVGARNGVPLHTTTAGAPGLNAMCVSQSP